MVTTKNSPDILMVVFLLSPDDTFDQLYISNYALLQVRDQLLRLDGVGDIQMFGARDYSMRLWLDPDKIAESRPGRRRRAGQRSGRRTCRSQAARSPSRRSPIARFSPISPSLGRLTEPDAVREHHREVRSDGRRCASGTSPAIELGALSYSTNSFLLRKPAVALAVTQRPGTNALATAESITALMADLKKRFPKGLVYNIAYNPTDFIAESVHELMKTVYEAMALVVIVVLVFLQRWRPRSFRSSRFRFRWSAPSR